MACLKGVGKVDSDKQRLRRAVIGGKSESKQDLRSQVGIVSSEQEELGEERISLLTSSGVAGSKLHRRGGAMAGAMCGEESEGVIEERSLVILSENTLRKAEANQRAESRKEV